jgi:hypothetical protein
VSTSTSTTHWTSSVSRRRFLDCTTYSWTDLLLHNSLSSFFERNARDTYQLLWHFIPNLDQTCLELWQGHVFFFCQFCSACIPRQSNPIGWDPETSLSNLDESKNPARFWLTTLVWFYEMAPNLVGSKNNLLFTSSGHIDGDGLVKRAWLISVGLSIKRKSS